MPFPGRRRARRLVPRAAVLPAVPQHLNLPRARRPGAAPRVPVAPIGPRPAQQLQVSTPCGVFGRVCIPLTAVISRPPEQLELARRGGRGAGALVPRAALPPGPPQQVQVPPPRGLGAHVLVPWRPVLVAPSQEGEVAGRRRLTAARNVPRAALPPGVLERAQVPTRGRPCADVLAPVPGGQGLAGARGFEAGGRLDHGGERSGFVSDPGARPCGRHPGNEEVALVFRNERNEVAEDVVLGHQGVVLASRGLGALVFNLLLARGLGARASAHHVSAWILNTRTHGGDSLTI